DGARLPCALVDDRTTVVDREHLVVLEVVGACLLPGLVHGLVRAVVVLVIDREDPVAVEAARRVHELDHHLVRTSRVTLILAAGADGGVRRTGVRHVGESESHGRRGHAGWQSAATGCAGRGSCSSTRGPAGGSTGTRR